MWDVADVIWQSWAERAIRAVSFRTLSPRGHHEIFQNKRMAKLCFPKSGDRRWEYHPGHWQKAPLGCVRARERGHFLHKPPYQAAHTTSSAQTRKRPATAVPSIAANWQSRAIRLHWKGEELDAAPEEQKSDEQSGDGTQLAQMEQSSTRGTGDLVNGRPGVQSCSNIVFAITPTDSIS